jgi:hypothetical protein
MPNQETDGARFRVKFTCVNGAIEKRLVPISDAENAASKRKSVQVTHMRSIVPGHRRSVQGSVTMTGTHVKKGRKLIKGW